MKIPITMCHGVSNALSIERFEEYFSIAAELGFSSINYDCLQQLLAKKQDPPARPIMFDFDHPVRSVHDQVLPLTLTLRGSHFTRCKHRTR